MADLFGLGLMIRTLFATSDTAKTISSLTATHISGMLQNTRKVRIRIDDGDMRNNGQNDRLWAMLSDISRYLHWRINGELTLLTEEDWKHILSAGWNKQTRIAAGPEGGLVILGVRTSKMKKKEMSEFLEYIKWFGDEHGVKWSANDQV
jgi:hypothetical protein